MYKELEEYICDDKNKGVCYVIENENGLVKVGKTKSPRRRLSQITNASGVKIKRFTISPFMYNFSSLEKYTQMLLNKYRVDGEWFNCEYEEAVGSLNKVINDKAFVHKEELLTEKFKNVEK